MTEMMSAPPVAPDDATWTLPPGRFACVAATDDVHDVLDSMRAHGLRQVLVAEAGAPFVTVIRSEDLLPYEMDPAPHLLREVAGSGRVPYSRLEKVLGICRGAVSPG